MTNTKVNKMSSNKFECKAECTWGDGPDILLVSNFGLSLVPLNNKGWSNGAGTSTKTRIDLNLKQAKELVGSLQMAIRQVEELEQICEDHDEQERKIMVEFEKRLGAAMRRNEIEDHKYDERLYILKEEDDGNGMPVVMMVNAKGIEEDFLLVIHNNIDLKFSIVRNDISDDNPYIGNYERSRFCICCNNPS